MFHRKSTEKYHQHQKIVDAYTKRHHHPGDSKSVNTDVNIMAIYLPQFHPFPENNKAWGTGFTEWTNVASSVPRFIGHQQPILPSDLGFYDLRVPGKINEQVELARQYGISGFDFYYYWFSGKKIMEMPIQTFLNDKTIEFKFSITWANENWARVWNDEPNNIIVKQEHKKGDALRFIRDVEEYLLDKRYVHINNKPLLTIYRPSDIPDVKKMITTWRNYWRKKHGEELFVAYVSNFGRIDMEAYGFDAERSLLPLNHHVYSPNQHKVDTKKDVLLDRNFSGEVRDIKKTYLEYTTKFLKHDNTRFKCISPSWDNQARRKGIKGLTFINASPRLYENTLRKIIQREKMHHQEKDVFVYINAWNEWAEAATLEPSQSLGHAYLVATRNAILNS